jgi:hypothetical protein
VGLVPATDIDPRPPRTARQPSSLPTAVPAGQNDARTVDRPGCRARGSGVGHLGALRNKNVQDTTDMISSCKLTKPCHGNGLDRLITAGGQSPGGTVGPAARDVPSPSDAALPQFPRRCESGRHSETTVWPACSHRFCAAGRAAFSVGQIDRHHPVELVIESIPRPRVISV